MTRKLLLFLLILGIKAGNLPGQIVAGDTLSIEKIQVMDLSDYFFPLTKDTFNLFPEKITVNGVVEEVSPGTSCGVVCGCGTVKIRLQDSIPGYHSSFVFIAIPCFAVGKKDFMGKTVKANLTKLPATNKECFYRELVLNTINSGRVPFYISDQKAALFVD